MRKRIICVLLTLAMLFSLTACSKQKKAKKIYDSFGDMTFSDESILTDEEREKIVDFKVRRLEAMGKSDVGALEELKKEWDAFSEPINNVINEYTEVRNAYMSESEVSKLTSKETEQYNTHLNNIKKAYDGRDRDALKKACDNYYSFASDVREYFQIYDSVNRSEFTGKDRKLMTQNQVEWEEYYFAVMDKALRERDKGTLRQTKNDWDSFVTKTHTAIEEARENLLKQWVKGANITSTLTNIFSFGTITTSVEVNRHTITIISKYNYDVSEKTAKSDLETYLSYAGYIIQDGVTYLKEYIDDVCIRVEYRNKNNSVLVSRDYN